jgi:hypothetical protein
MNELVKQMMDFAKLSPSCGFAMFVIVMAAMYYIANTIVGIFKWIAISIKGHPTKGTLKVKEDIDEV